MIQTKWNVTPKRVIRGVIRRLRDTLRGETKATYFDIFNPHELKPLVESSGIMPFDFQAADVVDRQTGMQFILCLLLNNPRLRYRFPQALSSGMAGDFAQWLLGPAGLALGLSRTAQNYIRHVFASHPGDSARRAYETRQDLRQLHPLGLCPRDRGRLLTWLWKHAFEELNISHEDSLWALMEVNESPDRGLAASYRLHPSWQQAVPDGLSPQGWAKLKTYLASEYSELGRWFHQAKYTGPGEAPQTEMGLNVLAHFRYPSGLQEAASGLVDALRTVKLPITLRDLPVGNSAGHPGDNRFQDLEVYSTTIVVAAANTFPEQFFPETGLYPRLGVKRIAYWYWELEEVPLHWLQYLQWADEVWAPTQFIAEAFRKVVSVPVIPMLPGVALPSFPVLPRSHFGIPEHHTVFLFAFDMQSTLARKNPLGVIEAFRRAKTVTDNVTLVIKVSRGDTIPQDLVKLRNAAATVGAMVIDRIMPRAEVLALFNCADCFISLHRSEGLGLGLIESMLMGKPVIATDYSGNRDFLNEKNGCPVKAGRCVVDADNPAYPRGCVWGDPDLNDAAQWIRWVIDHPREAKEKGRTAQAEAQRMFNIEAFGKRVLARLNQSSSSV